MDFNRVLKASLIIGMAAIFSNSWASTSQHAIACEQTYALCTSAPCVPDPENPGKSICDCAVQQGKSAGFTTCEKRKPYIDKNKAKHIVSTFSFEQFASKKSLACPKGKPWSNCVDMPCTIDPLNPNHAICLCQLNATHAFFTFGGNCDSNACSTGFWSGAIPGAASDALRNALSKEASTQTSCPTN